MSFFDEPRRFPDSLLLRMHSFSMELYQGYFLNPKQLHKSKSELLIKGKVQKAPQGILKLDFSSRARSKAPVSFEIQNPYQGF